MGKLKVFGILVGITFSVAPGQILLPNWQPFPGSCKSIGIAGNQSVPMCISTAPAPSGTYLDKWTGIYTFGWWSNWSYGTIRSVAMDTTNSPWLAMDNGQVWHWYPNYGWYPETLAGGYGAREIAVSGTTVPHAWAVTTAHLGPNDYWVQRKVGNGPWEWLYAGVREIAVDMGAPSTTVPPRAWVVASNGYVYEWDETINYPSGGWRHHPYIKDPSSELDLPGLGASDIAAGYPRIVFIIGNDIDAQGNGSVWRLNPSGPTRPWQYMHARGKQISLSHSQDVFVVKADNSVIHLTP